MDKNLVNINEFGRQKNRKKIFFHLFVKNIEKHVTLKKLYKTLLFNYISISLQNTKKINSNALDKHILKSFQSS